VPKKRRAGTRKPITAETRAADERLREALRNADLKAFDRVLAKAIKPRG
jgi:hypothetical protein